MPKNQVQVFPWRKSLLVGLMVAIIGAAGIWYAFDGGGVAAKPDGRPQAPPVPVTVAAVTRQDVPLLLEGIGTVQPLNIVTIRSRVDGELRKVLFTEGQEVHIRATRSRDRSAAAAGRADPGSRQEGAGPGAADRGTEGPPAFRDLAKRDSATQQSVDRSRPRSTSSRR